MAKLSIGKWRRNRTDDACAVAKHQFIDTYVDGFNPDELGGISAVRVTVYFHLGRQVETELLGHVPSGEEFVLEDADGLRVKAMVEDFLKTVEIPKLCEVAWE